MGTRQEEIKLCIYFFRDVFSYWRSKEQAVLYGIQILNTLRPFREDLEENNLEGKDNIYTRYYPHFVDQTLSAESKTSKQVDRKVSGGDTNIKWPP